MVTQRDAIDARRHEFAVNTRREARAVRRILRIRTYQIDVFSLAQRRQRARHNPLARFADDIANEKDSHSYYSPPTYKPQIYLATSVNLDSRMTVTLISPG